jgi:membrane glycosyltransferase
MNVSSPRQREPILWPLPPESPLAMPQQSLWDYRKPLVPYGPFCRRVIWRRSLVFGVTAAMTAIAADQMYAVLKIGGLTIPEAAVLGLFVLLFAWIAFSFVSTGIGFVLDLTRLRDDLAIATDGALPSLTRPNAVLLPTYNEEPNQIMARLRAIYESLGETGQIDHFDFFILSDTTDPRTWLREEKAFLALRREVGCERIFYRHRLKNIARKSGNIAEWIERFGGRYEHMVVLDADSLMEGRTLVHLAAAMESHPRIGLIQTLPMLINGRTMFARIQQFAGRIYGPLIAYGIAWWHGAEGNYWGHNAIIRVAAFASQAGLPLLEGRKPFGGHILSHDFVEAALMRRAGWEVRMAPRLGGSFEECPPSIPDYAIRDRRWCQGNLQHLGVLPARGLHWVSRLHLLTGIGSYITSPLWLVFLLIGILISLQAQFVRPEYFSGRSLFPQWPAQDPVRAAWVFAGTMSILLMPKLLGYLALLARPSERRACGGAMRALASVFAEVLVSGLMAPIMMLHQTRAVAEVLLGRDSGWSAQRREDGRLPRAALIRSYLWTTVLGVAMAIGAYAISLSLFLWMTPVLAGLVFSIPIVSMTSDLALGERMRLMGLLRTPEEQAPPSVAKRASEIMHSSGGHVHLEAVEMLEDPHLLEAHLAMLPGDAARRKGDVDVRLVVGLAKIEESDSLAEAFGLLTPEELFSLLGSRKAICRLLAKETLSG